jgi:hypothetical protein
MLVYVVAGGGTYVLLNLNHEIIVEMKHTDVGGTGKEEK